MVIRSMNSEIMSDLSRRRSRYGVGILAIATLIIAAFRFMSSPAIHSNDSANRAVLPIPLTQTSLNKVLPVELSTIDTPKQFHGVSSCNIATINGQNYEAEVSLPAGETVGLGGWLVDQPDQTNAKNAWIVLIDTTTSNAYKVPILFRTRREDVQDYFQGAKGFAYAGFLSAIDTSNLPKARYHLLVTYNVAGQTFTCDDGRHLNLY